MAVVSLPNAQVSICTRMQAGKVTWPRTLGMLVSRLVIAALFQAFIALIYALRGDAAPWAASARWWLLSVTLANVVGIMLLSCLAKNEGIRLLDIYSGGAPRNWKKDILWTLGAFVLFGPIAWLPNEPLAVLLFEEYMIPVRMMFQPLPLWAAYGLLVAFPITIALAELPIYCGYVMPRLEALSGKTWLAVLLASLFLSAQHMVMPLIFDPRFILYRGSVFLLFAFAVVIVIRLRPGLLPYIMVGHAVIDLGTAATTLMASLGQL